MTEAFKSGRTVGASYKAASLDEQQTAYDDWADQYERDLCAAGYRLPAMIASVFVHHVPAGTAPILDAGCGGGIQSEPLAALGYGPITGIDLSEGMLSVARGKDIYDSCRQMTLGEPLDFPDDRFAAIVSCGTITPKHAPPHSFDELIRVARPGAPIVFSLRDDAAQEPEYPAALRRLEDAGQWRPIFVTCSFHSMPYGEADVTHRIHVYEMAADTTSLPQG